MRLLAPFQIRGLGLTNSFRVRLIACGDWLRKRECSRLDGQPLQRMRAL